jgi:hypothetical protein
MATSAYDWASVPVMSQGPSREEVASKEQEMNRARAGLASAVAMPVTAAVSPYSLLLPSPETSLPSVGGLMGGLLPLVAPELRPVQAITQLASKAPAVVRPFVPSLVGSTAGTVAGTLGEQAMLGQDIFSTETGSKMLGNVLENAALDLGGNLAFSIAGKTYQVSKDALNKAGVNIGGLMNAFPAEEQARRAAQEWFSKRGATLTKSQLTGDSGTQMIEGALKMSSGADAFAKQQAGVKKAIEEGAKDVLNTLDTSDTFKMALKQGDPTQMAVGDRFQSAIKLAETAMKDKYRPVYEQLEKEGNGMFINMRPLKDNAKAELEKLAKRNFAGAGAERRRALEDIVGQADDVPLSVAHDLRSDLLAGAREAQKEGVPTTALQREYNLQADAIRKQMDSVMVTTFGNAEDKALAQKLGFTGGVISPAGLRAGEKLNYAQDVDTLIAGLGRTKATTANNQLLRDYFGAQKGYGDAMQGFYSGTVSSALKAEPSAIGEYLFNLDRPERMRETFGAIVQAQKYLPKEQSKGLSEELMYGYLKKAFDSPEGIAQLGKNLDNPTFKESFNFLFSKPDQRKTIENLANAAKFGTESAGESSVLKTKAISTGIGLAVGGTAYLALPKEITDKLDVTSSALSAGVLYLTPKLLARSMTSKQGMDTLAMITRAQDNPKFAGAASAKIADMLNKSGIIDSEYLKASDTLFHGLQQPTEMPTAAPSGAFDWNSVPVAPQQ